MTNPVHESQSDDMQADDVVSTGAAVACAANTDDLAVEHSSASRENRRAVFRIPVSFNSELVVSLSIHGKHVEGTVANIGLKGISVQMPPVMRHLLQEGACASVRLRLARNDGPRIDVTYSGIVRSNRHGMLGIQFPGHLDGDEIRPPIEYRALVMEMQREFNLRRHLAFKVIGMDED